jgi:hypothetical protein
MTYRLRTWRERLADMRIAQLRKSLPVVPTIPLTPIRTTPEGIVMLVDSIVNGHDDPLFEEPTQAEVDRWLGVPDGWPDGAA